MPGILALYAATHDRQALKPCNGAQIAHTPVRMPAQTSDSALP
jgi:hypothetical protein